MGLKSCNIAALFYESIFQAPAMIDDHHGRCFYHDWSKCHSSFANLWLDSKILVSDKVILAEGTENFALSDLSGLRTPIVETYWNSTHSPTSLASRASHPHRTPVWNAITPPKVTSPINWQWPIYGLEGVERLQQITENFMQSCDGLQVPPSWQSLFLDYNWSTGDVAKVKKQER